MGSRRDLGPVHGFTDFMYIYLGFTCSLSGVGGCGTEEEDIPWRMIEAHGGAREEGRQSMRDEWICKLASR